MIPAAAQRSWKRAGATVSEVGGSQSRDLRVTAGCSGRDYDYREGRRRSEGSEGSGKLSAWLDIAPSKSLNRSAVHGRESPCLHRALNSRAPKSCQTVILPSDREHHYSAALKQTAWGLPPIASVPIHPAFGRMSCRTDRRVLCALLAMPL